MVKRDHHLCTINIYIYIFKFEVLKNKKVRRKYLLYNEKVERWGWQNKQHTCNAAFYLTLKKKKRKKKGICFLVNSISSNDKNKEKDKNKEVSLHH